ncbi:hypothetical protein GPALN_003516 [Globodera pallida]|nr:hypothetical protein GPALN_003516 [Globodera pallida]
MYCCGGGGGSERIRVHFALRWSEGNWRVESVALTDELLPPPSAVPADCSDLVLANYICLFVLSFFDLSLSISNLLFCIYFWKFLHLKRQLHSFGSAQLRNLRLPVKWEGKGRTDGPLNGFVGRRHRQTIESIPERSLPVRPTVRRSFSSPAPSVELLLD